MQDLFRGSEFLTDLRNRWIRYFRSDDTGLPPDVVQILGSRERVVARDDNIDLKQFVKDGVSFDRPDALSEKVRWFDVLSRLSPYIALITSVAFVLALLRTFLYDYLAGASGH